MATMSHADDNNNNDSNNDVSNSSIPKRYIYTDIDLENFLKSPIKNELLKLISAMGKSCVNCTIEYDPQHPLRGLSPSMACLHGSLQTMLLWINDFPPINSNKIRFGNPAFKQWHNRLKERSISIFETILDIHDQYQPEIQDYDDAVLQQACIKGQNAAKITKTIHDVSNKNHIPIINELIYYLYDSFGHNIRLDYGTGHESSYQIILYVLCKIHCFGSTTKQPPTINRLASITISLYTQYLHITRQLQTQYMLEPAGSHGVWGLDDYHCLPFYFGSCQLRNENYNYDYTSPSIIHDNSVLNRECDKYLYFGCIKFIKELKKNVPFFESSPMLNDISQLPTWTKVTSGLLKLYEGEVLKKRQVVQHFKFGIIFNANWKPSTIPKSTPGPNETFRNTASSSALDDISMTRAPWATTTTKPDNNNNNNNEAISPTKAPWAM